MYKIYPKIVLHYLQHFEMDFELSLLFIIFCSLQEKDITLSGEHVREGLTCVVSVKVPNPEFEGQTKVRLSVYFIGVLIFLQH